MISPPIHPALATLLHYQSNAKLRRMLRGFSTPRRRWLSYLGLALAVVWVGRVAGAVLAREPTEPETFCRFVSLGLLTYGLWHVLRVVCYRPTQPFDLPPADYELLCGAPFRRRDLVAYRLGLISKAALFKAFCFSLVVLVDLNLWIAGLVGSLLALFFLDLVRMALEIVTCGMSCRTFQRMRATVVLITTTVASSALVTTVCSATVWRQTERWGTFAFVKQMLLAADQLRQTWIGLLLESPFRVFSRLCMAEDFSAESAGWLLLSVAMVVTMAWLVVRLDAYYLRASAQRQRATYRPEPTARRVAKVAGLRLPGIPWCAGAGPVAWRQAVGAGRHRTGLALALAGPGLLAVLPTMLHDNPNLALLEVFGVLTFYTFALLPSAFKFDFRRDLERSAMLKALPIGPWSMAIGQIATPILLATLFQFVVLLLAVLVQPVYPAFFAAALLFLLLLNVFVFATDNLIYLLYPYRLDQEGLEIFIRATLTFTAKMLLFLLAVGAAVLWATVAGEFVTWATSWRGIQLRTDVVFFFGAASIITACAALAIYLLAGAYRRLDPSLDTPA